LTELSTLVLAHYRAHARPFPWRRSRDPYAIWICEVMAQQTRLETMLPYWRRWMARFPDARSLAAADLDDVLALWAGLGYYARARSLHAAARAIVERHGGRFPDRPEDIAALPGIGPYTAGAIGSIAFGHALPVVDGNVARVLARVHGLEEIHTTAGRRRVWRLAGDSVPAEAPGDYNQGLMDIGATLCTPRAPACLACPLAPACRARATGRQDELPAPRPRAAVAERTVDLAWIVARGRWLLARRAPDGLYGGLWELPEAGALGAVLLGAPVATHVQKLTHRTLVYRVFAARVAGAIPTNFGNYDAIRSVDPHELGALGVSAATRALAHQIQQKGKAAWPTPKKRPPSSATASSSSSRASASSATTFDATPTSMRRRRGRRAASPR
jgi:A/G-specific adenine glycosylase